MAIGGCSSTLVKGKSMLVKKGAEANLYLERWHDRKVIIKRRLPKQYRNPSLDKAIRFQRTIHESQLIHRAKKAGIPSPTILFIDTDNTTIIMEYVEGKQVKQILSSSSKVERNHLCLQIGELIGRLHNHGIVHGDLTTSNMILTTQDKVVLIDFGLGERSEDLEKRGVDLHLMKRSLQSTHYKHAEDCFNFIIKGYIQIVGIINAEKVLKRIREIETRGRYVSER